MKFEANVSMSKLTTLQIGGAAKLFVEVKTQAELMEAIQYAKQHGMDYLVIGGGSNLLVNDAGVDCLVIKNEIVGIEANHLRGEARDPSGSHLGGVNLKVKSGTILQELVDYTIHHGLSGLHKLTDIPGTVGGAVYGNAGAYGQTISDHLVEATILDPSTVIPAKAGIQLTNESHGSPVKHGMTREECNFNYRDSGFKRNHYVILEITFDLASDDPQLLSMEAKDVLSKRLVKYPPGIKCPGSFFKNIVADTLPKNILAKIPQDKITFGKISAGYLLEVVGAQGQRLDGIEIANYHANLFVNKGDGTTKAFYDLAKKYAQKVKQKFGITLEPEVQLINLPPI